MNSLYELCLKMVKKHTNNLNEEAQNILACSILSIALSKGEDFIHKIPKILDSVKIHCDNRTVDEVLYDLDSHLMNCCSSDKISLVLRNYKINGDQVEEKRHLIIPNSSHDDNIMQSIEKTIHELIHLYRYKDIKKENNSLIFQEGIASKRVNLKNEKVKSDYTMLEEAIVQDATLDSISMLINHSNEFDNKPFFQRIKKSIPEYESNIYKPHTILFRYLKEDSQFNNLVDYSFIYHSSEHLESYFNSIMNNHSFSKLEDLFQRLDDAINHNLKKESVIIVHKILHMIKKFQKRVVKIKK